MSSVPPALVTSLPANCVTWLPARTETFPPPLATSCASVTLAPSALSSTLPVPFADTFAFASRFPTVTTTLMVPLPPVVRMSLCAASVVVVSVVPSMPTRFTLKLTLSTVRALASNR